MEWGDLNEGQRKHKYKCTIGHPDDTENFTEQK